MVSYRPIVREMSGLGRAARMQVVSCRALAAALTLIGSLANPGSGQTVWNGSADPNWNNSANWSTTVVPRASTNVVIPPGTPNQPSIYTSNPLCNNLTISNGAVMVVAPGFPLLVNAALTVNTGGALDSNDSVTAGSVVLSGTGTWNIRSLAHTVVGSWSSSAGSVIGNGTIQFTGNGSLLTGAGSIPNVVITAGTRSVPNNGGIQSVVSTIAGNLTVSGGSLAITTGTATYFGQSQLTVGGNATFTGGGLAMTSTNTSAEVQTLQVGGNFSWTGTPTLTMSSTATIRCLGSSWCTGSSFNPTSGTVALGISTAASAIAVCGGCSFPNLTIAGNTVATLAGGATVSGSLNVGAGASLVTTTSSIVVGGSVSLIGTGTWDVGTLTHSVAGNWSSGSGSVIGNGTIQFTGNGSLLTGAGSIPNVVITDGTRSVPNDGGTQSIVSTIAGNLTVSGGSLAITTGTATYFGQSQLTVGGNATFTGGGLAMTSTNTSAQLQTFQVGGNFSWTGTPTLTMSSAATIRCEGTNWSSSSTFVSNSGLVKFDGTTFQTVDASSLPNVTVTSTSATSLVGTSVIQGAVTVNGILVAMNDLEINSGVSVAAAAAMLLTVGNYRLSGPLTLSGKFQSDSPITIDGTSTISLGAGASLPELVVAAPPSQTVAFAGNSVPIVGNLTLQSGSMTIAANCAVSVAGAAQFSGGSLAGPATAILDVASHVTFSGTTCTSPPTIRCGGDWTADAGFAPTSGAVELDGTSPSLITATSPGSIARFNSLVMKNGVRSSGASSLTVDAATVVVQGGASFAAGSHQVSIARATATTMTVNGTLSVGAGGELRLGPLTTLTIAGPPSVSGTLSLIGSPSAPAVVRAAGAGGYGLTISGTVAARNYVFQEMGAAGIRITASATMAPPPNDLRGGLFTLPTAGANSVMLEVVQAGPRQLRYLNFENPNSVAAGNVRVPATAPALFTLSMVNWGGSHGGQAQEIDPLNRINWGPPEVTMVGSLSAIPGPAQATVVWQTATEVDAAAFLVERAYAPAGPFAAVGEIGATGVGSYQRLDLPLTPGQTYTYRLTERLTHGALVTLPAITTVVPLGAGFVTNVLFVGPGSAYVTVNDALAAATSPNSTIVIGAGTYPPFTVGPTVTPGLRIFGQSAGAVNIDTSNGPMTIAGVAAGASVELGDLNIGSSMNPNPAVVVQNCTGVVIMDRLSAAADAGHPAISIQDSTEVAVQRSMLLGAPGLAVGGASTVALSRTSATGVDASGTSLVRTCAVSAAVTSAPGAFVAGLTGSMPDVSLDRFSSISAPIALRITAEPNSVVIALLAPSVGWLDVNPAVQMVGLLDLGSFLMLGSGVTDAFGGASVALPVTPALAALVSGLPVCAQAVAVTQAPGAPRFTNLQSFVIMP